MHKYKIVLYNPVLIKFLLKRVLVDLVNSAQDPLTKM